MINERIKYNLKLALTILLLPFIAISFFIIPTSLVLKINNQFEYIDFTRLLFSIFLSAFIEEIICRYFIQGKLFNVFKKPTLSIIITSIIFSLLHFPKPEINFIALISYFIGGIMYGYTYYYFKNLIFPIILHFSWNFSQILYSLPMSGEKYNGIFKIILPNNEFIFGNSIGIESGLISILIRLFIILILIVIYKRNVVNKVFHKKWAKSLILA